MSVEEVYLSVVIPFHNEEGNLIPLVSALLDEFETLNKPCELFLVDDGSSDNSLYIASQLTKQHASVKCIELSRNFGQEQAILAGLHHASGKVIITMDADLQHPPRLIPTLISHFEEGYDVVNTSRRDQEISGGKQLLVKLFYVTINLLSGTKIPVSSFNFKMVSRRYLDEFLKLKENNRFDRGLIEWLGFKQHYITYSAEKRHSGKTNYSFRKLMIRSLDAVTDFSVKPLRFFFVLSCLGFIGSIIYSSLLFAGSMSFNAFIVLVLGVQFLGIGMLCEYISKVYKESKGRPNYVIRTVHR